MSEEAANATKAVPYGILMSIGSCWFFGFIIMIVLAACISPDLESVLGSSFGQPMAQVCSNQSPFIFISTNLCFLYRSTTMHWASTELWDLWPSSSPCSSSWVSPSWSPPLARVGHSAVTAPFHSPNSSDQSPSDSATFPSARFGVAHSSLQSLVFYP